MTASYVFWRIFLISDGNEFLSRSKQKDAQSVLECWACRMREEKHGVPTYKKKQEKNGLLH